MYNVIKFQAPFERLKEYSPSPEVSLFKAILAQALTDSTNVSTRTKDAMTAEEAKRWVYSNSDYFQTVCYFAELEPTFVIKVFKEAVKYNSQKRDFNLKNKVDLRKTQTPTLKVVYRGK